MASAVKGIMNAGHVSHQEAEELARSVSKGLEINHKKTRWSQVPYALVRLSESDSREMQWPKGLNSGHRIECWLEELFEDYKTRSRKRQIYLPLIWGFISCAVVPEALPFIVLGVAGHFVLKMNSEEAMRWDGRKSGLDQALACIPETDGGGHNGSVDGQFWKTSSSTS